MLKRLMYRLGWIHTSEIEPIAAAFIARAFSMGKMMGRNEVYCQQHKDALVERRVH